MNDSENKVPLAGDIPILGNLFRSTVKTTTKTELLIVLTPHVVRVAEDAATLSAELRDATGLNENIRHSPLMQGLRVPLGGEEFGPAGSAAPGPRSPGYEEQGPTLDPSASEELGPEVEEYGPAAATIRVAPAAPAVAFRPG